MSHHPSVTQISSDGSDQSKIYDHGIIVGVMSDINYDTNLHSFNLHSQTHTH